MIWKPLTGEAAPQHPPNQGSAGMRLDAWEGEARKLHDRIRELEAQLAAADRAAREDAARTCDEAALQHRNAGARSAMASELAAIIRRGLKE